MTKSTLLRVVTLSFLALCPASTRAVVHVWTGGGANENWNNTQNWSGGVPAANEAAPVVLEFPPSFPGPFTNNIPGLKVDALRLSGSGQVIRGAGGVTLTLRGGNISTNILSAGINYIDSSLPVLLEGTNRVHAPVLFTFLNALSGTGGLRINGTVSMNGGLANTFTGSTILEGGALTLNRFLDLPSGPVNLEAIQGPVIITEGVLRLNRDGQIDDDVEVRIEPGGTLDLNGRNDTIASLVLSGGEVQTDAGVLTVEGSITAQAFGATINGKLSLGGVTRTFDVSQLATLVVNAAIINGTGASHPGIAKTGPGTLRLAGANTFTGALNIFAGTVEAAHDSALGSSFIFGTTVGPGALLRLRDGSSVDAETLTLNGGSLYAEGLAIWGGPVTLNTNSHIRSLFAGDELRLLGPISGAGGIIHAGSGRLTLGGTHTNTFAGPTLVADGVLNLNKPPSVRAISGTLAIGDATGSAGSAMVRLLADYQIGNPTEIDLRSDGVLHLDGHSESVNTLDGGGEVRLGSGQLQVTSGDYGGIISGTGGLLKVVNAALRLSGANTYTGQTTVDGGQLFVNGTLTSTVRVKPGAFLGGHGTVGNVSIDGGRLSPGNVIYDPATLKLASLVLTNGSIFRAETRASLLGGWERDQADVDGAVNLTGSKLEFRVGGAGSTNSGYLIIKNTGNDPVVGTFEGLPEGTIFTSGGAEFQITYQSGDGNDVVIRQRSMSTNNFEVKLDVKRLPGPSVRVIWPSFASNYALQYCTNLAIGDWKPSAAYQFNNGTNAWVDWYASPNWPQTLFRLVSQTPP